MQLSHEVYHGIAYLYPHSEYMCKEDFLDSNSWSILAVNNAGTINKNNKTWNVPAEDFDMVVDTNIKGTANVLRHFVPLMIEKRHGIIINLSSGWGRSAAAEVRQKAIKCIIVVSFCLIKILIAYYIAHCHFRLLHIVLRSGRLRAWHARWLKSCLLDWQPLLLALVSWILTCLLHALEAQPHCIKQLKHGKLPCLMFVWPIYLMLFYLVYI